MEMKITSKWLNLNLRMNKFVLIFLFLFFSFAINAQQVNLGGWSTNYTTVSSYNGATASNAYTLRLDGNGSLQMPTWRLSAKVTQPISNGNQTIPANKISLLPTTTYGQFNPNNVPTAQQIGIPAQTFLQQSQEVFLVPQALTGLYNNASGNSYYNLYMVFDLKIEGGAYLANYTKHSEFKMMIEFKFYDDSNKLRGTLNQVYTIQIGELSGIPPITNQLSLKVAPNAKNSLLNLATLADYIQGSAIIVPNGLIVQASTDYELKVRSTQASFTANSGATLPLQTVGLNLINSTNVTGNLFPIRLSSAAQRIAIGNSTQGNSGYYDIKYYTQPNDPALFNAKMEEYSTVLQYEIVPK